MRIAFYAPLKSPIHPVASGDRQMARMLIRAMERAGHRVDVASDLRAFTAQPSPERIAERNAAARSEVDRLATLWRSGGAPDLWFTYHPYYKAPDLIGPAMAAQLAIPYVTAEASYAPRRDSGPWAGEQGAVAAAVRAASLNICFTRRDREGLEEAVPGASYAMLPPFIDVSAFSAEPLRDRTGLVAVAMMRPGDKLDSYRMLGKALETIAHLPWTLTIVGDGRVRSEVVTAFAGLAPARIAWLGERSPEEVPALLYASGIHVWPGCGEAYGLAYLEAQAAGLPVIAQDTAGVPEVVRHGKTGLLTLEGDIAAYAGAIARLLENARERRAMGAAARRFVLEERSLEAASERLGELLERAAIR